ncbi:MAG: hypothetical protein P1U83_07855 [Roseovarius sp.]|nr:hypothetical protein [Roseovarius sp.]
MTWLSRHIANRQVTAMVLGFVLALRLVAAPFILSSPVPGVMAICSGGQITYISMDDGQPVQDIDGAVADPCPFFGVMSVLPGGDVPVTPPLMLEVRNVRGVYVTTSHAAQPDLLYHPRAPPLLS